MKKKVVSWFLREDQIKALAELTKKVGISKSEAVRRAVDQYLNITEPKEEGK
jgi:hypothetical protein